MTKTERQFLNGILRKTKPKKLLEVGVSAGGSTINMLNAIKDIPDAKLYSIDYNTQWYVDSEKETGWRVKECTPHLMDKWELYTGGVSANFLEKIGGDIDLCLLDTVHSIPGELLDILMILPFMKPDGIIILHDTSFHYFRGNGYSNGVLFSSIVANKFQPQGYYSTGALPNIGAFQLNRDTMKYVENIFYSLNLPWQYMPTGGDLEVSVKLFCKYYDSKLINILKTIIWFNKDKFNILKEQVAKCGGKKYPKWFIKFLCWFITNKESRRELRRRYI
ncbi:MAG: class I SAM-dependent methyltransferase [Rickettsiales bacterium]|nr:class I SAM-dependent methyltransferase [Rickettsiales bacterium]